MKENILELHICFAFWRLTPFFADSALSWGQKVVRFYDPDGNLIEVGTPV